MSLLSKLTGLLATLQPFDGSGRFQALYMSMFARVRLAETSHHVRYDAGLPCESTPMLRRTGPTVVAGLVHVAGARVDSLEKSLRLL